ncbi:MAG TPA: tetratricopeptide repeat protein, partial [Planctomycetota bacterium]|nr:tetratricopeptide repeat protein [Planctomycetota bacterium]
GLTLPMEEGMSHAFSLLTLAALTVPAFAPSANMAMQGAKADRLCDDARVALERGQDDRALALARSAWRASPGHAAAREIQVSAIVRIGSRLMAAKDHERARDLFREGLAIANDSAALHLGVGQTSKELHDVDTAILSFERATRLDEEMTPAFVALGSVLYERHRFAEAKVALQRALELDPKNGLAKTLMQRTSDDANVEGKFKRHESQRFELAYNGERQGLDRFQDEIQAYLDECYANMQRMLRKRPARAIRVMLYTKTEFKTLNRNADWVQAYYDGKVRVPVDSWEKDRARVQAAIRHELTHAYLQEVYGTLSAWLHEGIAQRIEGIDEQTALRETGGRSLVDAARLRRPFVLERNPERARLLYAQSVLLFMEIERRLGSRGLAPLFERIVEAEGSLGEKEDAALVALLGVDLEALIRSVAERLPAATPKR